MNSEDFDIKILELVLYLQIAQLNYIRCRHKTHYCIHFLLLILNIVLKLEPAIFV